MMKSKLLLLVLPVLFIAFYVSASFSDEDYAETKRTLQPEAGCVFMTVMGEQPSDDFDVFKNNENLKFRSAMDWHGWKRRNSPMEGTVQEVILPNMLGIHMPLRQILQPRPW